VAVVLQGPFLLLGAAALAFAINGGLKVKIRHINETKKAEELP
jgi:hypothetical protein